MRALILAAGLGTRLASVRKNISKPMFPVGGEPLIGRIVDPMLEAGIDEIVVVIRKNGNSLERYLTKNFNIKFTFVRKNIKRGLFGLYAAKPYLNSRPFFFSMADSIFDKSKFFEFFNFSVNTKEADVIMAATSFLRDEIPTYIVVDDKMNVIDFGKRAKKSRFVSAGIYYCSPKILKELDNTIMRSISRISDFFGFIVHHDFKVKAYDMGKVIDVDDEEDVIEAEKFLKSLEKKVKE